MQWHDKSTVPLEWDDPNNDGPPPYMTMNINQDTPEHSIGRGESFISSEMIVWEFKIFDSHLLKLCGHSKYLEMSAGLEFLYYTNQVKMNIYSSTWASMEYNVHWK